MVRTGVLLLLPWLACFLILFCQHKTLEDINELLFRQSFFVSKIVCMGADVPFKLWVHLCLGAKIYSISFFES